MNKRIITVILLTVLMIPIIVTPLSLCTYTGTYGYTDCFDDLSGADSYSDVVITNGELVLNSSIIGYVYLPENITYNDTFTEDESYINTTSGLWGLPDVDPSNQSVEMSTFHVPSGDSYSINVNFTVDTTYTDFSIFDVYVDGLNLTSYDWFVYYMNCLEPNNITDTLVLNFVAFLDNESVATILTSDTNVSNEWVFYNFTLNKLGSSLNWANISIIVMQYSWYDSTPRDANVSLYFDHLGFEGYEWYYANYGSFISKAIKPYTLTRYMNLLCVTNDTTNTKTYVSQDKVSWTEVANNTDLTLLNVLLPVYVKIDISGYDTPAVTCFLLTYVDLSVEQALINQQFTLMYTMLLMLIISTIVVVTLVMMHRRKKAI